MVPADPQALLAGAAAGLASGTAPDRLPAPVRAFVTACGLTATDLPLLRLGAGLSALFRLPAPDAPGLAVFGARVDLASAAGVAAASLPMASASGVGETPGPALRACLGEAAELLASTETPADSATLRPTRPRHAARDPALTGLLRALPWPGGRMRTGWHPARRLTDGAETWLPREVIFRTPADARAFPPPWPLSLGCGAGPTPEHAALHGLLELAERDAATLWWRGGLPGHAIALEHPAQRRAAGLLARLRGDRPRRRSWLLDITSDLGIATVAALSVEADGRGLCCGTAARAGGLAPAAEAAVLELTQLELGLALARHKAARQGSGGVVPAERCEGGPQSSSLRTLGMNARDAGHLRRAAIDTAAWPLLHPAAPPRPDPVLAAEDAPAGLALAALVGRLAAAGLAPIRLDHAPPLINNVAICIPVTRMLCPGLELDASYLSGERLRAAMARTGGGGPWREGVGLT
jgi:ribosomal protein S12 methylthiotransferase accessory factor